jgi:hypothetical protein
VRNFITKTPLVAHTKAIYNVAIMDDPKPPSSLPEKSSSAIDISDSQVSAGGDIVGGDVHVAGDSIRGQTVTVQRGFAATDVQRLVLTVGGLVFVTAACFFLFGAVSAGVLLNVLARPVESSPEAAASMQRKVQQIQALPPDTQFQVVFSEDEISSYFRFILGPQLGVTNGKARLMDETGQIALGGNLASAGGLPFLAEMQVTTNAVPIEIQRVWLKVIPTPEGVNFGWIPIPAIARDLQAMLNERLFGQVRFTQIGQTGGGTGAQPAIGINLVLAGITK